MGKLMTILFACMLTLSCQRSESSAPKFVVASKPETPFTPNNATLSQQKMCDEQAAKRFNEYIDQKARDFDSYTSHYDPSVNVCYVRVNQTLVEKIPGNSSTITDAFEGRVYATYLWSNPKGKKYWEVAPTMCEIYLPAKDVITCSSSNEFDSLTEKYFGVAK